MNKHTPGPWTYHATAGNHDFEVYPEATGKTVALVLNFDEANAALIATAPDLLDDLLMAQAELVTLAARLPDPYRANIKLALARIEVTLAKVKGGSTNK